MGVCRDAHLAIALSLRMNIPALCNRISGRYRGFRRNTPIRWILAPGWRSSWMAGGLLILDTAAGGLAGLSSRGAAMPPMAWR